LKKNKPTLTLMVGLARSGKSTWTRKHNKDAVIVCPDTIRSEIFGHQFHKNAEDFVWAIAKSMVKILIGQKIDVIVDATNLTYFARGEWLRIANDYSANVRIVWIKTSVKECIRRNNKSSEGKKLPSDVIEKMAMIFENPHYIKEKGKAPIELIEIPKRQESKSKIKSLERFLGINNYYQHGSHGKGT